MPALDYLHQTSPKNLVGLYWGYYNKNSQAYNNRFQSQGVSGQGPIPLGALESPSPVFSSYAVVILASELWLCLSSLTVCLSAFIFPC